MSEGCTITTEMVEAACVAAYGADWRAYNASGWPQMQNALRAALPNRLDVSDFNEAAHAA